MKYKENPDKAGKSELEQGFIDCGSPYDYPVDRQEGKPEKPALTSRESRLHNDGHQYFKFENDFF